MRVGALYIYPVKACAAVALDEARLEPLGIAGDRRFAFVGDDGRALTQREHPLLATIRPVLSEEKLRLDLGGLAQLELSAAQFQEPASVDVWGTRVPARLAGERAVAAVGEYLGACLRLAILEPGAPRAFVDSRPVLVTTTAMLAALNALLEKPVGMERFRPNIVLEGDTAARTLRTREVRFDFDKPCGRCEVTTVDQASGARRGPEPLATLSERFGGDFGVYYRVTRRGTLRRGEAVEES